MGRKKNILKTLLCLSVFFSIHLSPFSPLQAQKYACVNTEYIMQQVPDYVAAMNKLGKFTEEWRKELESKQQELDELRQQYQQEAYLLPDNLKQRRQEEIRTRETELRALQHQRFGAGGDLDKKRAELIKPVQDRIYGAIERVATEKNYAFVFDRSAGNTVVYVSDKYDISKQVLEMLGIKPGATTGQQEQGTSSGKTPSAPANSSAEKGKTQPEARDNSRKR